MRFSYFVFVMVLAIPAIFCESHLLLATEVLPKTPQTATESGSTTNPAYEALFPDPLQAVQEITRADEYPVRVRIPSIKLDAPIENMGLNDKGEMDVPSGKSNNVGWYEKGTIPGELGSAVFDAHVFAALKNLKYLKVGADIFVQTKGGKTLHFRVEDSRVYKLADVPLQKLFNRADDIRLNLITCAGTFIPKLNTYDKRLIVYAVLVRD